MAHQEHSDGHAPPPPTLSQSVPVLEQSVPFLIGKAGKSIQRICTITNTICHVSDTGVPSLGQTWRYVTIKGTLKDIDRAKKLIILYHTRWAVMSKGEGVKGVERRSEEGATEGE